MIEEQRSDILEWLQEAFLAKCDGSWEHGYGVRIDTLDNPGWSVQFDIGASARAFSIRHERTETDWVFCEINEGRFIGHGGPRNLVEILSILRDASMKDEESSSE